MEYNFSSISIDALYKIEKKLGKICEDVMNDINNFIYVLNDEKIKGRSTEMNTVIHEIMRDQIKVTTHEFTEVMKKVQSTLGQYL